MKIFDSYAAYYDQFYGNKDYLEESKFVYSTLREYFPEGNEVVEFGAGTGKHAHFLKGLGIKVHGVELSKKMIARACKEDFETLTHGDMTNTIPLQGFDFAFSLFHVVSYLDKSKRNEFFSNLSKSMNLGGIFVFDFWFKDAVEHIKPELRVKKFIDDDYQIIRIAEPIMYTNECKVEVNYSIFLKQKSELKFELTQETHLMNYIGLPELDDLAHRFGFRVLAISELLTGESPSDKTWALCATIQKVK